MKTVVLVLTVLAFALLARPSGAFAQSEEALRQAIEKEPRTPAYHKELAKLYSRKGAYLEAIREYESALALVPSDADARRHLAELFGWTRNFDRSIVTYQELIAVHPENLQARIGLAQVFRWSQRYVESEEQLREVLRADPKNRDAIYGMAQSAALAGDFAMALTFADLGISLYPQDAELHAQKGIVLSWSGNSKEGITFLKRAVALDPASPSTYRSLADTYAWRKEYRFAVENYRKALELEPDSIGTALDLARAYKNDGNKVLAEEVIRQVLRGSPDHHQALELLQEIRRNQEVDWLWTLEEIGEPVVFFGILLILMRLFYKRWQLRRLSRLYRNLYRFILPCLFLLFLAAYAARIILEMGLYYEIAEIALTIAVALLILLLSLDRGPVSVPMTDRVLVVGAHPDDIELGAAGAMLRFTHEGASVYGLVITKGENGTKAPAEKRQTEAQMVAAGLGLENLWVLDFPDTQLRQHITGIREAIEKKIEELGIQIVITHSLHETHGDHAAIFEAAKEASRTCSLLCYESISAPKEFVPNYFVDITSYLPDKLRAIGMHKTQRDKFYMDPELIRGRAAHRGLQAGVRYAEAFWIYKWVR